MSNLISGLTEQDLQRKEQELQFAI